MARNGTLQAFDANGGLLVEDGPKPVAADAFTTRFEVTSPTPAITKAVLQLENAAHYAIDDLEFDGERRRRRPAAAGRHHFAADGAEFDTDAFTIEGTITGEGLLSTAQATVEFGRPPEQTVPPFTTALSVFGTGTTRQFNCPAASMARHSGPIKITVEAENFAGEKGSATSTITNLPPAIRNRAAAEGAAARRFSVRRVRPRLQDRGLPECGDQRARVGNKTFVIRGDILAKWIPERGHLGCPLAEERPRVQFSFAVGNWCLFVSGTDGPCEAPAVEGRVQDFTGGRIHSTTGIGTFYVPLVFVDAIKKRGGEEATGVPMADPTSSVGAMETWLFQRFVVPELPKRLPSTLEIRGTPPRVYLERQAGHLLEPSNGQPLETTGTIWEHFSCDGNLGPCTVEQTPAQPDPIPNTGEFCFGGTVASTILLGIGPRAWEPVLEREPFFGSLPLAVLRPPDKGNFISTPLFGVVTFAKLADVDLTLIHEWCYGEDWIPLNCFSDWIFRIRPYGAHAGARTFPEPLRRNQGQHDRQDRVRALLLGRRHLARPSDQARSHLHRGPVGHRLRARHLQDGASPDLHVLQDADGNDTDEPVHRDRRSESVRRDAGESGSCDASRHRVNGWYPGDPIEFDVHPPPRPVSGRDPGHKQACRRARRAPGSV